MICAQTSPVRYRDDRPMSCVDRAVPAVGVLDVAGLYRRHRQALVRMAVLLVDDLPTAEDVVQDAFGKLHAGRRRLRDPDSAAGYLRVAVVNGCRSVLRRRRTARLFTPPLPAPVPG